MALVFVWRKCVWVEMNLNGSHLHLLSEGRKMEKSGYRLLRSENVAAALRHATCV